MRVVAFISPKGGAGKTTAALTLALGLVEAGEQVAMIDADPNKPLVQWASRPNCPSRLTVHPAPMAQDIPDAVREARRRNPAWLILDTEGSTRGAMMFMAVRPDLVLTPLAGSQLEAVEAIKAAEMVKAAGGRSGRPIRHFCLLTRIPAAIRPRSLKAVVEQLHAHEVKLLPVVLMEKEAFRALFAIGGGFAAVEREGVSGLPAARSNADAFVRCVLEILSADLAHRPAS